MKRLMLALCFLLIAPQATYAISLAQAQAAAEAWTLARKDTIQDRVLACITEGNPRICHTAWAGSVTPNTTSVEPSLKIVTYDDPGRLDQCGLPTGEGTYAAAGIALPASGLVNAKINITKAPGNVWGAQLVIQIQYEGTLYERAWGKGSADGFDWREVIEP